MDPNTCCKDNNFGTAYYERLNTRIGEENVFSFCSCHAFFFLGPPC